MRGNELSLLGRLPVFKKRNLEAHAQSDCDMKPRRLKIEELRQLRPFSAAYNAGADDVSSAAAMRHVQRNSSETHEEANRAGS